ncbi:amino acid permease/ SLC12A domain-containing protein [Bisporella sp. PMI_857]|nr:amino acid permease/ SLC12A domain-containing protein [Bisporella sp. PMI_857]
MATIQRNRKGSTSPSGAPGVDIEKQSGSSQSNSETAKIVMERERRLARLIRKTFHYGELDRVLERPHIAAIAFSGTVGAGIFVTSGELIGISGSVGCVISYICAAFIIIPVMRTIAELMAIRPTSGALMDYPHTFVDPALGFAVGVTYCLANCMSMATLTSAAARAADNFSGDSGMSRPGLIGIIIGFFVITLLSNLCGITLYANIERVVFQIKVALLFLVCILMILVKAGVGSLEGHQQEVSTNSTPPILNTRTEAGYGRNALVPFFRFDGFNGTQDKADGGHGTGVPGASGQLLAILTSVTLALFTIMGGEIVAVTAGEAKRPRRDLPSVARLMYLAPLTFYIVAAFLVGLSINYMDPRLFHPWAKPAPNAPKISHSPFIIVLSDTSIRVLPKFLNACFMLSAYTTGNTALFTSSRTLFSISQLYGKRFKWIKGTFGTTNDGNTPIAAILACSLFSLLAFLGLCDPTFNQPILSLAAFYTGAVCCVYASQCIAFLRFKSAQVTDPTISLCQVSDSGY